MIDGNTFGWMVVAGTLGALAGMLLSRWLRRRRRRREGPPEDGSANGYDRMPSLRVARLSSAIAARCCVKRD